MPFNLEAMKLSAYYKRQREIVIFASEFNPKRHTKFFFRKDYDDGVYPKGLTLDSNKISYGGLAFSGNVYEPLAPDIECMHPDTSVYEKAEDMIIAAAGNQAFTSRVYKNLIEAEHCRISLDGQTVWPDYPKQFRNLSQANNLILHDYNLAAIKDSNEVIKEIFAHTRKQGRQTQVGTKFPVQISNPTEFFDWLSIKSHTIFSFIQYQGLMPQDAFMEWINNYEYQHARPRIEYLVTPSNATEQEVIKDILPYVFKQVVISRGKGLYFPLKCSPNFFSDPLWETMIAFINQYHRSGTLVKGFQHRTYNDTLYDYARRVKFAMSAKPDYEQKLYKLRSVFALAREQSPLLFQGFYEWSGATLEGEQQ